MKKFQLKEFKDQKKFSYFEEAFAHMRLKKRQYDTYIEFMVPKIIEIKKTFKEGIDLLCKARLHILNALSMKDSLNKF